MADQNNIKELHLLFSLFLTVLLICMFPAGVEAEGEQTIDLALLSDQYTAQDGDVLTGSTSGTVTIAADAKITLSDVTITGGIICAGTTEITLVGTNSVSGATNMAGIQVGGSGTTLTIKGNGSLTANGANNSAGIGLSRAWKVDATGGDIVIEGGNITATGKGMGAGIGTGVSFGDDANHTATIGNITIKGGTVTAIGGTNQFFPGSGIGKGGAYSYGNTVVGTVTITTDIDLVDASSISEIVTYKHGETDVTSIASDYFTINEDGNRRIIVPKDDIDYNVTIDEEITGGTVTADKTTAKAGKLVALTVTPESGYVLQSLTVKDASDNDVSLSNREFVMPRGGVTVSATFIQTTAAFDEATGVLTLNGNVDADEVKAYGAIIGDYGAIVKESPVTSVVCEPGTVLPADCSELFLNYTNLITIDLSNADISGVTNMSKMFGSRSLTTIYVNSAWSMENVTSSDQMFYGCNLLRGGNGSRWEDVRVAVWESNGNDLEAAKAKASRSSYAIIDGKGGLPGYLTVKPKQTPSAPTANVITYTGEAQELVSAGDGTMLYSLDDGIYSAEIPTATAAGTYTVHYKVDGSDNWNAVIAQTVEVTIAPKALSITAKDMTIVYGDEPANDGVEYSGFVGSDDASVLGGTLAFNTDYKQYGNVGTYAITPSGLTADNYDISFASGTLTVEPKKTDFAAVQILEDENGA
ncbi:MAG: BspA family leucine-rich repeat surface protein, partial [Fibrobacter sp.]|nr:BspA family leucine-rich repeat surface protein [Fibrobacter sp.]